MCARPCLVRKESRIRSFLSRSSALALFRTLLRSSRSSTLILLRSDGQHGTGRHDTEQDVRRAGGQDRSGNLQRPWCEHESESEREHESGPVEEDVSQPASERAGQSKENGRAGQSEAGQSKQNTVVVLIDWALHPFSFFLFFPFFFRYRRCRRRCHSRCRCRGRGHCCYSTSI